LVFTRTLRSRRTCGRASPFVPHERRRGTTPRRQQDHCLGLAPTSGRSHPFEIPPRPLGRGPPPRFWAKLSPPVPTLAQTRCPATGSPDVHVRASSVSV